MEAETGFFYKNTVSEHLILVKNPFLWYLYVSHIKQADEN